MLCALFFFGGVGYLKFFVAREPDREQIAIMLAKKQVAQSGFDTFLTEAKYKSMYRLPGVSQKTADTEADEIGSLIRTIKAYGLNEVHFLDGSANQALVAARRLALIGRDEPRVIVALSNLLPELKRQRSAFRNLAAQMEADNLISIIFDIVTKNAMKPN